MSDPDPARREAELAGAEAARIGGSPGSEPSANDAVGEAQRPLVEAGEGESEGFEEAERELADHASHSDQHAARRVLQDAPMDEAQDVRAAEAREADIERSGEREQDET